MKDLVICREAYMKPAERFWCGGAELMEDMEDLVICWEAYLRLTEVLGVGDVAIGDPGTVLGDLARIEDVIIRHSSIPDAVEVLEGHLPVETKVKRLLGN